MADPVRLKQIFWNLLTNAIKFSTKGSKVSVKVERNVEKQGVKARVMVRVIDSGKGIDAEFLPKIFERFSQEDNSSIRIHGGLGLGLAIVRNLVELHGGQIQAESLGANQGATFTVLLPIKSESLSLGSGDTSSSFSSLQNPEKRVKQLNGARVLIVEDEANTREALSELLLAFGAVVKSAKSAQEALSVFLDFKPQVLISDIAMPGEDGYSMIQKIRSLGAEKGANVPAIAVTAYAGSEDIQRALAVGFQAHISKPIDGEQLVTAIAALL
jgi:two-component system, chemotaxis family, CheB/CheR fusion protein